MRSSLIIATYNWPEALECCLLSVLRQKTLPFEVIIADDGSADETRHLIENYQRTFPVPLQHIWQADEGFRLGKIRNKAMAAAGGDYIIQTDGDIILHPRFINDHQNASRDRHFIGGSRVLIDKKLSDTIIAGKTTSISVFANGMRNKMNGLRLPPLAKFVELFKQEKGIYNLRGCNMSFWKKDILAINGYNENISGWGREDTELAIRLYNRGLKRVYFKFQGIAYHLYHPEYDRSSLTANDELLSETIENHSSFCEKGLNQYLP